MAKYPEFSDVQFDFPLNVEFETRTLVSSFDGLGKEKRRRKFNFARRNLTISYTDRFLTRAQMRTLWQFYLDRGGMYEAFSVFITGPAATVAAAGVNTYEGEYVGVGDGTTKGFDLPSRYASAITMYYTSGGSTLEYSPGQYDFSGEAGADGCDRAGFDIAPVEGSVLSMDFTGQLKVRCRFMDDRMSYQDFYNIVGRTGVELKGLLNDE